VAYFCLNVHGADQNPCTQSWQWYKEIDPVLTIGTAPQNVPDTCVGQISVTCPAPTTQSGQKVEMDVNDCPGMEHYRSRGPMEITPVNTWYLPTYPPGTTPTSGTGLTATFTTFHGGTVQVQFRTQATYSSPAWDSGVLSTNANSFRVFEVASLVPQQGNLLSYGPPLLWGICVGPGQVLVRATPNPSVASPSELPDCWSLSGSSGVTVIDKVSATVSRSIPSYQTIACTSGNSSIEVGVQVTCPTQTITRGSAYCGATYGADFTLCYPGCPDLLYWGESITAGSRSCYTGAIQQTPTPFVMGTGNCALDFVTNPNGQPAASCQDVTYQAVRIGPRLDLLPCAYSNTQTISVSAQGTPPHGTITTTDNGPNGGAQATCSF
jgi:hypothetical protein